MAKTGLKTILIIVAVWIWAPWVRAWAVETVKCPRDLDPMTEAVHVIVTRAEKKGAEGDSQGAAAILTDYLQTHPLLLLRSNLVRNMLSSLSNPRHDL